jgi:hypothetical protein
MEYTIKLWQIVTGVVAVFEIGFVIGVITVAFFSQAKED